MPSRRAFLSYLFTGGASFFAGHVAGNVYHAEVTRHRLNVASLTRPLRVAQLSDLHYGPYLHAGSVRGWVRQAQAEEADLVVLTGDTVDRWSRGSLTPLVQALGGLSAPLGVWACLGNHDRYRFGARVTVLEDALAEAGITLLVNRGTLVRDDLYLAGVDDYSSGTPNLAATLGGAPGGAATLLMCHQPDYFPRMTLRADLTLAGHTHGGQVQLPFVGAPVTSSEYGQRYLEGWVPPPHEHFGQAYVSRGLGVSFLPVRLNCPPDLERVALAPSPSVKDIDEFVEIVAGGADDAAEADETP